MTLNIRKDAIVENFFGVDVADPYRWLEDEDLPDTKNWTEYQNEKTRELLDGQLQRKRIKNRIIELNDYVKYSTPKKVGDYYYFFKNDGLQNQPVYCRGKSLVDENFEVVLNPNQLNSEGTAAITEIAFNQDGTMIAYAISYNGSDWQDVRIKNLETGADYPEVLKWCKFSSFAWSEDSTGFFYNRYPDPSTMGPTEDSYYNRVYWHRVNTSQEEDKLIYEESNRKERLFYPIGSDDNKYLILNVNNGTEPINEIYYKCLDESNSFVPLIEKINAYFTYLGNDNSIFYFETNENAPKGKIISIDLSKPERKNWKEILPEGMDPISFTKIVNDKFVVCTMHNASHKLKIYGKNGSLISDFPLPDFITISEVTGKSTSSEMLVGYVSFLQSMQIVKYDFDTQSLSNVFVMKDDFSTERYETKQIFYTSKDGTKIPMFLTFKKGIELNQENPVLLYGYGGYNISITPSFSPALKMWIEQGGIYAVANIRGGAEYGEEWHQAALFEKRQNSYDDFISAAEWLIRENYTKSEKLAIMGRSNGGLLVGVCITQRPDLFGAALCLVPVTDMLRFHRFTVGRFWTTEFGNAEENENDFKFLYKYSPLHNVKEGVEYPPTLISTADTDDRVVPMHAKKFGATLQEAQCGDNPILLRVEKNAGHGLGKPLSKQIEEDTDLYTFLFKELKINFLESKYKKGI
ncbi:prolyl oligopeptidase family serine peptidase [Psychrobacillus sp. FSL H8-0484]|uniref:prolyl oligopeptidase family serine peptidase n=1 Tax=Psychrobacillus sp. FSL H8-0484 TaxID=2921390 RepID=UPI0030F9C69B